MGHPFRDGLLLSLSLSQSHGAWEALNDRLEESEHVRVFDFLFENRKQNIVVNRREEFFNIAFQYETLSVCLRNFSRKHLHPRYAFVRSLQLAGGI